LLSFCYFGTAEKSKYLSKLTNTFALILSQITSDIQEKINQKK